MKTDAFFQDIKSRDNIVLIEETDEETKEKFKNQYLVFNDKFFYEQFLNCGGIIIDSWIRLYGCGEINVIDKNKKYNSSNSVDIIIGEDILGGLFGIKDDYIYYYAPDTNKWENLEVYYTVFLDWLINKPNNVNQFYELYRWNSWKEDCKKLKVDEGFSFYPLLQSECDIEKRSRKIINIDELIRFNLNI